MTTFSCWSGIVHANLSKFHPSFKYSHAQEILAAALGHRTYASLRALDYRALHECAKYCLLDDELALHRAAVLGLSITLDEWQIAAFGLKPNGISGDRWMINQKSMSHAARVTFEDSGHPLFTEIARTVGVKDGHWAMSAQRILDDGTLPVELKFLVMGEIWAFDEERALAMPVVAEVTFQRVGKQLYGDGKLLQVEQCKSPPREYEPNLDAEVYGIPSE